MSETTRIKGGQPPLIQTETVPNRTDIRPAEKGQAGEANRQASFAEMLRIQQGIAPEGAGLTPGARIAAGILPGGLRFSAHAQTRLQSRQISLGEGQLDRLSGAVQKAANKGSRDALVLMDDLAMVVSVSNRTVVTVVDKDNLKQNVFTNIDSAVIA